MIARPKVGFGFCVLQLMFSSFVQRLLDIQRFILPNFGVVLLLLYQSLISNISGIINA
jgi:hypothetical protein